MITEQMYKEAQQVIKLYELQVRHLDIVKFLPTLEAGFILEYKDLTGRWYTYTKILQDNVHFIPPLGTRVRKVLTNHINNYTM